MPRARRETTAHPLPPAVVAAMRDAAMSVEQRCAIIDTTRRELPGSGPILDRALLEQLDLYRSGLERAQTSQEQLKAVLEQATQPPLHVGTFLQALPSVRGDRALVACGDDYRVVSVGEDVALGALGLGDTVFINHQLNLLLDTAPASTRRASETGSFSRWLDGGRLLLKYRDEEIIVDAAACLRSVALEPGDQLRWSRDIGVAFERIARPPDDRHRLATLPAAETTSVGGQEVNLRTLLAALTLPLLAPASARLFRLDHHRRSVLLVGHPGTGKTLLARVAVTAIGRLAKRAAHFFVVKPAAWESAWVGETEANIRACFAAMAEAARDGLVVLFIDEVDCVGRIRGQISGHHSDRFLAAFLAELDGFAARGNVAIIAATNRKDLIDPALLERLSDVEIVVDRPDRRAAMEILRIHLPADLPFADSRDDVVAALATRFYAPNAAAEICRIRLRDGTTQMVRAHELASGRLFRQICEHACRVAALRHYEHGELGLTVADVDLAAADAIARLATTLTPHNARAHLDTLPQDLDVIAVEPIVRRVPHPHDYRSAA